MALNYVLWHCRRAETHPWFPVVHGAGFDSHGCLLRTNSRACYLHFANWCFAVNLFKCAASRVEIAPLPSTTSSLKLLMSLCPTDACIAEPRRWTFTGDGPIMRGEICGVRASVHDLINHIFAVSFPEGASPEMSRAMEKFQQNARFDTIRPCLVCEDQQASAPGAPPDTWEPPVCIMATFGGDDISNLPSAFHHFIVPVSPNRLIKGVEHIHTNPEWDHPSAYIFAYVFRPGSTAMRGRWLTRSTLRRPHGSNHYVDVSTVNKFLWLCDRRWMAWISQSRATLKKEEDVFRVRYSGSHSPDPCNNITWIAAT
jgi:hypothetical protein